MGAWLAAVTAGLVSSSCRSCLARIGGRDGARAGRGEDQVARAFPDGGDREDIPALPFTVRVTLPVIATVPEELNVQCTVTGLPTADGSGESCVIVRLVGNLTTWVTGAEVLPEKLGSFA